MNAPIRFSRITSDFSISKKFILGDDGGLQKAPGGNMKSGHVDILEVRDLKGLAGVIAGLNTRQALSFGVPRSGRAEQVVTKHALGLTPGAIARSRAFFEFPAGRGLLLLDYDPPKGADALKPGALRDLLIQAVPVLAKCEMLISSSASSYIYRTRDGECLKGPGGMHVFVPVDDARDITAIGAAIDRRCWLAGLGYVENSKSGATLLRSIVDTSVWQPERLSFDAGADCGAGLEQRRPSPLHWAGQDLSFADVLLSDKEAEVVEQLRRRARGLDEIVGAARKKKDVVASSARSRVSDDAREPQAISAEKEAEIFQALLHVPPDCPYETWVRLGMSLKTVENGLEIWDAWSRKGSGYPGRQVLEYKWSTFDGYDVTLGTFYHIAAEHGYKHTKTKDRQPLPVRTLADTASAPIFVPPVPAGEARAELEAQIWEFMDGAMKRFETPAQNREKAPILGLEITTGTGKSTSVRQKIQFFRQWGLPATLVAQDKKAAEEYEKAGAFFRHGRENLDRHEVDPATGKSRKIDGFSSGKAWHCPHAGKDGPVETLAESEHMISEMCRSGHCAHGNQRALERARAAGQEPGEVVVKFFRERPEMLDAVPACTWLDHHEAGQEETVCVVVSQGLGSGDLKIREDFGGSEDVGLVALDEKCEWTHSRGRGVGELRRIIIDLEKLLAAEHARLDAEETAAAQSALDLFRAACPALGAAAAETGEGVYISAPDSLAGLIAGGKDFIKKHGNVWERAIWSRWTELEESPLRIAFEIARAAASGGLSIVDGQLVATYIHPVIEEVAGKIPLLIMDATLDPTARGVIESHGGRVSRIVADQWLDIEVDPRRFMGQVDPDSQDYRKRIDREVSEYLAARENLQDDVRGAVCGISRKQLALEVLGRMTGQPAQEIGTLPREQLWALSISRGVGWFGWHDRAHDAWKDRRGMLLWGQQPIPPAVLAEQWEGHRSLLIHLGAKPESLPHWDGAMEKQLWVATGEVGGEEMEQRSACRLPDNPDIREWLLGVFTRQRVQAVGRLRGACGTDRKLVRVVGGAPLAGLGGFGMKIARFARITGQTGAERREEMHAARLQETVHAAGRVVQSGGTISRNSVQEQMRNAAAGVCLAPVKDIYKGETNPPAAARHETYSQLLEEAPWLAPWLEVNGRSARLVRRLQEEASARGQAAAARLLLQLRALAGGARLQVERLLDLAAETLAAPTLEEYHGAARLILDLSPPD